MPRKITSDFTFSNGTHVPAHNWIVVPQQAQMKDPSNYEDPETFNGFRFVNRVDGKMPISTSRLSHPSWKFPYWGSVKQAWSVMPLHEIFDDSPARFYVTDMTKLILRQFIMDYDFKLANPNVPTSFAFGPLRTPHPRLAFLMKKRVDEDHEKEL
jgi:hypothetical protein